MALSVHYEQLPTPLWKDEQGTIQIAKTHITLDVIIAAYQHGDTPNEINRGYPTLTLAEIYAILNYYLNHREAVNAYLRERDEQEKFIPPDLEAKRPENFALPPKFFRRMIH